MKHATRLARSGAIYTAPSTRHRERPFGRIVALVVVAAVLVLVLLRGCDGKPVNALVVPPVPGVFADAAAGGSTPSAGSSDHDSDHELYLPFVSLAPLTAISTCDSEANACR